MIKRATLSYHIRLGVSCIGFLCILATSTLAQTDNTEAKIRKSVEELVFAINAKDKDLLSQRYSATSILVAPSQDAIVGVELITDFWVGFFEDGASGLEMNIKNIEVDTRLASVYGTYSVTIDDQVLSEEVSGEFILLANISGESVTDFQKHMWNVVFTPYESQD